MNHPSLPTATTTFGIVRIEEGVQSSEDWEPIPLLPMAGSSLPPESSAQSTRLQGQYSFHPIEEPNASICGIFDMDLLVHHLDFKNMSETSGMANTSDPARKKTCVQASDDETAPGQTPCKRKAALVAFSKSPQQQRKKKMATSTALISDWRKVRLGTGTCFSKHDEARSHSGQSNPIVV